jgi:hypothetical protein
MSYQEDRRTAARDLLRELLEEAREADERHRARNNRLRTLVRAGRAARMSPAELAEASGLSRAGVYEVQKRDAQGPVAGLDEIVLVAIAAGGATTREALASTLGIELDELSESISRLAAGSKVAFGTAGYEGAPQMEIILLSPPGEQTITYLLRRARHRQPERWTAYMAVKDAEAHKLVSSAEDLFGRQRVGLVPATTRRDMVLPELAIRFEVDDEIALFNEAAVAWEKVRRNAELDPAPIQLTAYSAPRIRSSVLEAFGRGACAALPQREREIMREAAAVRPNADEQTLAVRALTHAAAALRLTVGQRKPPPMLSDSELAFAELQAVVGLQLDATREKVQQAVIEALERATDRLGPLPGGRSATVRAPGGKPNVVETVSPSLDDLTAIAAAAGAAIGYAENAGVRGVKVTSEIEAIASGDHRTRRDSK